MSLNVKKPLYFKGFRRAHLSSVIRRSVAQGGVPLKVPTSGARLWRFKYCLHGREKLLSPGQYPDVPLSRAREERGEAWP